MKSSLFLFGMVLCVALLVALSSARAEEEEQTLLDAGLSSDGPALLAFFHARARRGIEEDRLLVLLDRFASGSKPERDAATAELLSLGPLALPVLRQAANDLDHPETAKRATRCLSWLEAPNNSKLLIAAARTLVQRKPEGAAAALLAYLPVAIDPDVIAAVNAALMEVATPDGKPDAALLRGLGDALAVRRAAAGVALCRAAPPDRVPEVRKLLKDPAAGVRLRTALALAEAHDAEAIPVLIDLLAELSAEKRRPVEEFLIQLAGEWAPRLQFETEDEVSRHIRRDAWASWWRHSDGGVLLAAIRAHTFSAEKQKKVIHLIACLGAESFAERENASKELFALGRLALPWIQKASKSRDPEVARRVHRLIERIQQAPPHPTPLAVLRLLAVRKPAGAVEALLAYLPDAEDETRSEEGRNALTALAQRDGKADPALLRALAAASPVRRAAAIQALAAGGGAEGRSAVRKLFEDKEPLLRLRAALALARAKERDSISVLIDLLAVLPAEQTGEIENVLDQLAGDSAPQTPVGGESAERAKCRDAWAAWWKVNARRVNLAPLAGQSSLGFTLLCDVGTHRVYEIDRLGRERWSVTTMGPPTDAWVLSNKRVLIAEVNSNRITERDFQGKILWQKQLKETPLSLQPLPNGHVFIACAERLFEVDRAGTEHNAIDKVPGKIWDAYRTRSGEIICLTQNNQCLVLDKSGKQLQAFASNHGGGGGSLNLFANDRILVAQTPRKKVVEFDRAGKVLREVDAPGVAAATALPNGHILVSSEEKQCVYELDRAGKIVWERKVAGKVFRARRR